MSPGITTLKRLLLLAVLSLFAVSTLTYADDSATTRPSAADELHIHDAIRKFWNAILAGDVALARKCSICKPEYEPILKALVRQYAAEQSFCETFKNLTESDIDAGTSLKRGLKENLPKYEIIVRGDVAHSMWGDYTLRKVDGIWLFDFDEAEYTHAWSIPTIDAEVGVYEAAEKKIKQDAVFRVIKMKSQIDWGTARADLDSLESDMHEKFKVQFEADYALLKNRMSHDIQGRWIVTLDSHDYTEKTVSESVKVTATIQDNLLTIQSDRPAWNGQYKLHPDGLDYASPQVDGDTPGLEWSITPHRSLDSVEIVLIENGKPISWGGKARRAPQ
jgi:hypothetical protein